VFLSEIMIVKTRSGSHPMNVIWDFPMLVHWPFVGKGKEKAAQQLPREVRWDGPYF